MGTESSLQESNPPLSTEEQDLLDRGKKKVKITDNVPHESAPEGEGEAQVEELETPKPMEEGSPMRNNGKQTDESMLDLDDGNSLGKPETKRGLWPNGGVQGLSYKERLLGINGRGNDDYTDDDPFDISEEEEEEMELEAPPETEDELFCPTLASATDWNSSEFGAGKDSFAWIFSKDGQFSTKSAYMDVVFSGNSNTGFIWKKIWKCPAIQRAQSFLWILSHDCIMTESQRLKRKLSNSDMCRRCNLSRESSLHAIRDCPLVKPLWYKIVDKKYWSNFFSLELRDWVVFNLSRVTSDRLNLPWSSTFGTTCWYIWKQRNDWVFNNKKASATVLTHAIDLHLQEITKALALRKDPKVNQKETCELITWKNPEKNWIKINVDGSYKSNTSSSACGGVARDHDGNWLFGFSKKIGASSALHAEIWSIWTAMKIAKDKDLPRIIIETDSKLALDLLLKNDDTCHPLSGLVRKIKVLLQDDWMINFSHIFREGNRVANALACHGHSASSPFVYFESAPSFCKGILLDDCKGTGFPRGSSC
ncbi:putative ribonuclease H protein [Senna tora]|uniref:Putative ribonuclease H protein n=1 Tax=Senna tora TaxID=362788 RepID=A0A834XFC4_9FABA|nr:putative ribonuclease H protein [Senna tora]KAF7843343.1 putative ribonuclease H protein [Senna tora]KAF7843349.1 putative ribonuclease H protein [Senna tora]